MTSKVHKELTFNVVIKIDLAHYYVHVILHPFLQVTEETSTVLRKLGYSCDCRGFIDVKGKGELKTFFVCTDTSKQQSMGLNWGPAPADQELIGFYVQQWRSYRKDCGSGASLYHISVVGTVAASTPSLLMYNPPINAVFVFTQHPVWVLVEKGYTLLWLCHEHDSCERFSLSKSSFKKISRNCSLYWLFMYKK